MRTTKAKMLIWSDDYSVGNELIDSQHKKLFSIINDLELAAVNKTIGEKLYTIIEELINYTQYHFSIEEGFFDQYNYKYKDDHKHKHSIFIKKINKMSRDMPNNQLVVTYQLRNILHNWLIDHIRDEDFQYKEIFTIKNKKNG